MNEKSSRSHSVFSLEVHQTDNLTKKTKFGKLFLVDLAGSESTSEAYGQTLQEANTINQSLSKLKRVITSLAEGASHIPYRESNLTKILANSIGGHARTTLIVHCSTSFLSESETKQTLTFGATYSFGYLYVEQRIYTTALDKSLPKMICSANLKL